MNSKKIIVTGGCGFIGSNFIMNQLCTTNNKILNLDKLTYAGNADNLNPFLKNPNYSFMNVDICNKTTIKSIFEEFLPDFIINFAAETHVDRSIDSPESFILSNIFGTFNLLNASIRYHDLNPDFKFIQISTDEVYGSLTLSDSPFTEKNSYYPSSPYSASKASADHMVMAWHKTYGLPVIISNCSNNYGPFQYPEKLIPLIIANCIDEKPLPVYGKGENIRDWLYVSDHCLALDCIMNNGQPGNKYNIGGNNEIKNIDIVLKICSILDKIRPRSNNSLYSDLIVFVKDRPGHDFRYAIDSSQIQKDLGWEPTESFESGIQKTIKWYLENVKWWRKIQKNHYNQERLGLSKTKNVT